jgi:hypothetical protein
VLRFASANAPRSKQGVIRKTGADSYEIALEGGREYVVAYTPPGGKAR